MARLRGHPTLDQAKALFVLRAGLVVGGRVFELGESFPWRNLGISPRKLHQLWIGRRIGHEQPRDRNGAEDPGALVARAAFSAHGADGEGSLPVSPPPSSHADARVHALSEEEPATTRTARHRARR